MAHREPNRIRPSHATPSQAKRAHKRTDVAGCNSANGLAARMKYQRSAASHKHTHTHTHTHAHTHAHTNTHTHACTHARGRAQTHRYVCMNIIVGHDSADVRLTVQRCVVLRHISLGGCRKLGDVAIGVNGVSRYCALPLYFDLRAIRGTTGYALAYTSASHRCLGFRCGARVHRPWAMHCADRRRDSCAAGRLPAAVHHAAERLRERQCLGRGARPKLGPEDQNRSAR